MGVLLAKNGVQLTLQGEGTLIGVPMVFVRLAGCSVGCSLCDTDYAAKERVSVNELVDRVRTEQASSEWIWITGGEPSDQELTQIVDALRCCGKVGLASSGVRSLGLAAEHVDFLSISPHFSPDKLRIWSGHQINLVPGLGKCRLSDWASFDACGFQYRYVTPLWVSGESTPRNTDECREFVLENPSWRLGVQAHKTWGVA